MSTAAIIAIAVAAVLILILLVVAVPASRRKAAERREARRREELAQHEREEGRRREARAQVADAEAARAEHSAGVAREEAQRTRAEARLHEARAELHEHGEEPGTDGVPEREGARDERSAYDGNGRGRGSDDGLAHDRNEVERDGRETRERTPRPLSGDRDHDRSAAREPAEREAQDRRPVAGEAAGRDDDPRLERDDRVASPPQRRSGLLGRLTGKR